MKKHTLPVILLLTLILPACKEDNIVRMHATEMQAFTPETVKWQEEGILPKGAQSAILVVAPSKKACLSSG